MQNEPMFQVQVDETEDTEWNDILRAKGVIPERPPSPTAQLEEALEEALAKQHENRLEDKALSELDELEDDEDEEFLEFYKQKRIAEMTKLQERSKFGDVYHVSKPEYNREVTDASMGTPKPKKSEYLDDPNEDDYHKSESESEGVYVFVHLSLESKLQSRILSHLFQVTAPKFSEVKFVEIQGNRAIENYPDANCPTLLVYHKGDVLKNIVTLLELGGNDTNAKDFEKLMVKVGAVKENDSRLIMNADSEEYREERKLTFANKKIIRSGINGKFNLGIGSYDSEDSNEDDDFFN